jgi:hypothetical protein
MAWEYSQSTGVLTHNGQHYAFGYSGKGKAKNDPSTERILNTGPIPKGHYRITGHNNHKGPWTVILEPIMGTNTFGRTAFRVHGDNPQTVGDSSEGCIVINGAHLRQRMVTSGDTILVVR